LYFLFNADFNVVLPYAFFELVIDLTTFRCYIKGGTVTGENKRAKVNGILETTRGLGNHGDPNLKSCIVTDPFVRSIEIDNTAQLLIVASHGLWEVLSEQDAADLALQVHYVSCLILV
jgi:hypothetical protein